MENSDDIKNAYLALGNALDCTSGDEGAFVQSVRYQDLVHHNRRLNSLEEAQLGAALNHLTVTPRSLANDITSDIQEAKKKLLDVILGGRSIDIAEFDRIITDMEATRQELLDGIPEQEKALRLKVAEMLIRSDKIIDDIEDKDTRRTVQKLKNDTDDHRSVPCNPC